jgi:DNA-binding transcriptional LysR family regulator
MRPGDLNLLLHFDALMSTRSVSRAAEQLEISQPAVSAALNRLRRLFNDPLLVREGGTWRPTHKAEDLHARFRPMLDMWREVSLPRTSFDPSTAHRVIGVFGTDYMQFTVFGRIAGQLAKKAPGLELRMLPAPTQVGLGLLESNQVELVAGYYPVPAVNLRTRFLYEEKVVCLVRAGHPCLRNVWNLEAYLAWPHADLAAYTRHFSDRIDRALLSINRSRRVSLSMTSYLAAPFAVGNSDFIATVPLSIAEALAKQSGCVMLEVPLALPLLTISLYWHERHHRDAGHAWLRQFIAGMF